MKKTPGVAFYGKVRIPTIGHKTAIDAAKDISKKVGGKLTVGLSGTAEPLDLKTKKILAQKIFGHPVNTGTPETKTLASFLSHLNKSHDELHLVAGSDRVPEYKAFIERYNGKADKKGNVPFHFKKVEVHTAGGERTESSKDPRKMSQAKLTSSVSASKLEKLAKEGKWEHFKAYHPGMSDSHVRRVFTKIRTHHGLNESIDIGLSFARKEMPQIGTAASFVKYLRDNDIESKRAKVDPNEFRSSQMEFDRDKIESLKINPSRNPIIVSNDGHILDGHHRWLADKEENRKCDAIVCDLPILDLLYHAKNYSQQLKEEVTRKELAPMLDSFVSFASDKLGLKSMPTVRYKTDNDDYNSFAAYNPSSNELSICTINRHPMDIFRSVAHELVHHKQNEDGRLGKDIAKEGATGSDIENEANAEAGKIMRWFAKANPNMFDKSYVVENNTTGLGGIRGLGNVTGEVSPTVTSQYVSNNLAYTQTLQGNQTKGLWIDDGIKKPWLDQKGKMDYHKRTEKSFRALREQLTEGIYDPSKLKAIFLAGGPGSGKDYVMNATLSGEGLKEINSDVAFEYLMQKNGLDLEMPDEERVERDIVRGRAKNITKEQERLALAGRLGLIINGTADDLEKIKKVKAGLEADGYETMMVFVNTSNEVSRERNVERGKMGNRKVPDGTDKNGVPDNSPNIRQEKWDAAQKNIGELQKIFGNESFAVIDNTVDIRKADPETKAQVQTNFNRVRRMAQQFVRADNKNPAAKKWIEGEAQKRGITYQEPKRYKTLNQIRSDIPKVIHKPDNDLMLQARRLGLSYYGFGRFGRKVNGINKVMFHSKGGKLVRVQTMNEEKKMKNDPCWKGYEMVGMKKKNGRKVPNCVPVNEAFEQFVEANGNKPSEREIGTKSLTNVYRKMTPGEKKKKLNQEAMGAPEPWGYNFGDNGVGPTFAVPRAGTPYGFGYGSAYSVGLSESIVAWMKSEKTQKKFAEKYGNIWEEKLIEAALKLEEAGCGCSHSRQKSMKKIKEGLGGGVNDMSMISTQRKGDQEANEQTELETMPRQYTKKFITPKVDPSKEPEYYKARTHKRFVAQHYHPERLLPAMHEEQLNERGADSKGLYRSTESGAGLTRKGAKHFGVKTAVTTPPSKLKPGSKAAKRRKSFCARMGGMKGPMKDEKGRPTRKAMSLRRWNCEE